MRVNELGVIIYEVGDVVILNNRRPSRWNSEGHMDKYLGKTVTITAVHYCDDFSDGYFEFKGSSDWSFNVTDIVGTASPELMAALEIERQAKLKEIEERNKEKFKHFVFKPEEIYNIAVDVFGEDRVDLIKEDERLFNLTIFFPEITIKNSEGYEHTIKDLYFKFKIRITLDDSSSTYSRIEVYGRRLSVSDREYSSDYGHSHLNGRSIFNFSSFCLGSSDFGLIMQSMRLSITAEDWLLLFFSLENYVSWESLEGGPYRKMKDIKIDRNVNLDRYKSEAISLINKLPDTCLTFNDGKVELINDHPSLFEYYNLNSTLKSFQMPPIDAFSSIERSFDRRIREDNSEFKFKGQIITPKIFQTVEPDAEQKNISAEVVVFYNKILNEELKKYNQRYEYTKLRETSSLLREIATI